MNIAIAIARCLAGVAIPLAYLAVPMASADPNPAQEHDAAMMCRMLDRDSSADGVESIVILMLDNNVGPKATAETLALAVHRYCSEYADEVRDGIEALVRKYPRQPAPSTRIGIEPTGVIS